jgi:hypothetical protein
MGAYAYTQAQQVSVIISEIHYHPQAGDLLEFVELVNTGVTATDLSGWALTRAIEFQFPAGTWIAPGECIVVAKLGGIYAAQNVRAFTWTAGQLSDDWGEIQLENELGEPIDYVNYCDGHGWAAAADGTGPSLELRGLELENLYYANWRASLELNGTPGRLPDTPRITGLTINELMAINDSVILDANDQYDDWIELYNSTDTPIDVGGLYITDDLSRLPLYPIPLTDAAQTTIPARGFLLLWADDDRDQGVLHLDLKLSGSGEQLSLVQIIDGFPVLVDQLTYGVQTPNVSFGRQDDGSDQLSLLPVPTPGSENIFDR